MSSAAGVQPALPELALEGWEDTKDTIHRWVQIVGKVRMASTSPRNHWWHVPLYVDVRGLTTRRMRAASGVAFEIRFDFVNHRLVVATERGDLDSFALADGLSVAAFDSQLHAMLAALDVDVAIRETPFDLPDSTPFPADRAHDAYDRDAVERFWRILGWTDQVLEEFAGWYCGKTSPVHLFWHSLDLALTRFGGRRAAASPTDRINREAYSHELISFGFWAGDPIVREATYYSYTSPEPADLRTRRLHPEEAFWDERPNGSLALLPYEAVRSSADARATLLAFLESAYRAGAAAAGWDSESLESSWCPSAAQLSDLLRPTTKGEARP